MVAGRLRRGSAGASMERALRAISPKATNNKSKPLKVAAETEEKHNDSNADEEAVKVAIRIRPLSNRNDPQVADRAWKASRETNSIAEISTEKKMRYQSASTGTEYEYDKVFGEDSTTQEIYEELVSDIVGSVKDGVNGTVFTYGQTSSGKTYTMRGDDSKSDDTIGILQMAATDIFRHVQNLQSHNPNSECKVCVSYTEIYNEELRDLLNDRKRKTSTLLAIREDKRGAITIEGRKEVAVSTFEELVEVFRIGEANKSVGCTKMNDRSSRSHVIFQITLQKKTMLDADDDKENNNRGISDGIIVNSTSTLNLVDLAGSESVRHTGAVGVQKKEGGMINQSLLTLSKVLMSLGKSNPGHINYRDSKLTRILKPSLSGNARMAVICCITPSAKFREETKSTLQFATRAKLVTTNATSNETVEDESDVVAKLRLENIRIRDELRDKEKTISEMTAKLGSCVPIDAENYKDLESQLTTANDLVASLERQVDELSSQKNDALDWIEELFSKVEVKENKIKEVLDEKNRTTREKNALGDQLSDALKQVEEVKLKNEQLQQDQNEAAQVIASLKHEIKSMDESVVSRTQTGNELEDLHSELARVKEDYDISQHTLRKVRADNEELRHDAETQISELMCEIEVLKSHQSTLESDNDTMVRENEELNIKIRNLEDTLHLVRNNNEELRKESQEQIVELDLQIKRLTSQQTTAASNNDEVARENEQLKSSISVLEDAIRQVRAENEELHNDLENQVDELNSQVSDLQNAASKDDEDKKAMELCIDKLKKELAETSSSAHSKQEECRSDYSQLNEKLSSLEQENKDLRKRLCDVDEACKNYEDGKEMMLEQIEHYERDLSCCEKELAEVKEALKSKVNEVDYIQRSVKSRMAAEKERAVDGLQQQLNEYQSINDNLMDEIKSLRLKNKSLETDGRRMNAKLDEYQRSAKEVASKVLATKRLLDEANQRGSDTEKLESDKEGLLVRLRAADEKIKTMKIQLQQTEMKLAQSQDENVSLKEREGELRGSVLRIRELVDNMKRRNSELEEENNSFRKSVDILEKGKLAALAERDNSRAREDELICERDAAFDELESAKLKLDTLTAEFEADSLAMRTEAEITSAEKRVLNDKIALLEAGKFSIENKSDRILERENALVDRNERLVSEYKNQAKKMVNQKQELNTLSLAVKRLELEKKQLLADRVTLRETIKAMRIRLRSSKSESGQKAQQFTARKRF